MLWNQRPIRGVLRLESRRCDTTIRMDLRSAFLRFAVFMSSISVGVPVKARGLMVVALPVALLSPHCRVAGATDREAGNQGRIRIISSSLSHLSLVAHFLPSEREHHAVL